MDSHKLALTIPEAVSASGLSRSTLYKAFAIGAITPRKAGRRTVLLVSDLQRFIDSLPKGHYGSAHADDDNEE